MQLDDAPCCFKARQQRLNERRFSAAMRTGNLPPPSGPTQPRNKCLGVDVARKQVFASGGLRKASGERIGK